MKPLIVAALLAAFLQAPAFRLQQKTLETPDGTTLLYGRAVPGDYDPKQPRPLVLALHPGGQTQPHHPPIRWIRLAHQQIRFRQRRDEG